MEVLKAAVYVVGSLINGREGPRDISFQTVEYFFYRCLVPIGKRRFLDKGSRCQVHLVGRCLLEEALGAVLRCDRSILRAQAGPGGLLAQVDRIWP